MNEKIAFSLEGSLVDLNSQAVPNFNRESPIYLEKIVDDGVQTYAVPVYVPAFYSDDGAFLLEPHGINLISYPLALNQNVWIKGSNVIVQPDESVAPDASWLADRVIWAPGNGNTQVLKRTVAIAAAKKHTLSLFLRLRGGQFGSQDVIRVTGGVVGSAIVNLSQLNKYLNRYRILELTFTSAGSEPTTLQNVHQDSSYTITSLTNNSITISTTNTAVTTNSLLGGQVAFSTPEKSFVILSNTAFVNGSVTIVLDVTNLTAEGVTTANSKVFVNEAANQLVTIEVYCESTAALDWGGIQLEERDFRTSPIYQQEEITVRAATRLFYRSSPIANLRTFGIFINLKEWRGDGNLFDFVDFRSWIVDGKLRVAAGSTEIGTLDNLPKNAKIFVQLSEESSSLSLFVNGVLKARTAITGFVAGLNNTFTLTSLGFRAIYRLAIFDKPLLDGNPTVGAVGGQEVAQLFSAATIIDPVSISSHAPLLTLAPVTIPPPDAPTASSSITAINSASNIVTVADATGFLASRQVAVTRLDAKGNMIVVVRANTTTVSGANITLNTTAGVVIGDTLVFGNIDNPGSITVRFPYDPIDQQIITAIDVPSKRLTVASALSFTRQRAFITTPLYQDKAEVVIQSLDFVANTITVDNVSLISVGDIITQPLNELWIDPANYFAGLLNQMNRVQVALKYQNGLVIENRNPVAVLVRPFVRVFL